MSVESQNFISESIPDNIPTQKQSLKMRDIEGALAGLNFDTINTTDDSYNRKAGLELLNLQETGIGEFSGMQISEGFINRFNLAFNKQEQFENLA